MSKNSPSENTAKALTRWVCIGSTGTFADSQGRSQTFTATDLDAIAASYDPATLEAPLVFGHPQTNAPAYGWVNALKREGEKLFARFAQVPVEVKKIVEQGHYRYVSMSLMPDRRRLRHVGLLGAAVPAIEGLGAVEFSLENEVCIDFSEESSKQGAHMPTMEELQQQIGALQQQIESLKTENATLKAEKENAEKGKAEAEKGAETATADFAAYKNHVETQAREARVAALIEAGKVKPAEKDDVLSFAATLAQVSTPVEFSASDGKKEQLTAEERYLRELEARPADDRFMDFSGHFPLPAHAAATPPTFTAADMTAKM